MAYIPTFHTIAKIFALARGLSKSKRNHNILSWKREYPACVTKVTNKKNTGNHFLFFSTLI
jgi:hypothetical protein